MGALFLVVLTQGRRHTVVVTGDGAASRREETREGYEMKI